MAQIFDTSSINQYQVPATPIKGGVTVNSTEVGQETSPAPAYNSKYGVVIDDGEVFNKPHPILPGGNVLLDVVTHLSCHKNLNLNIDVLMSQFKQMKADLDAARIGQAKAERALIKEREEKEMWKGQAETLEKALKEALEDLAIVRGDLVATEERLRLSIIQLTETASKLESTRKELRLTVRERDLLARQLANVQRELEFYTARCLDLQVALDAANAGENAANDRNTRLTAMLYQIESSKAAIERIKDDALAKIRELEMTVEELKSGRYGWPEKDAEIIRLTLHVANLERKIIELKDERNVILVQLEAQKSKNAGLSRDLGRIRTELEQANANKSMYENAFNFYAGIAKRLRHYNCAKQFPELKFRTEADGTVVIDKMDEIIATLKAHPVDDAEPSEGEVKVPEGNDVAGPSTDANKDIVIPPPDEPQVSIPGGENGVPTEGDAEPGRPVEGETETPARPAQDPLEA